MLSRDGANGYFISTSRTKTLNPGDWKSDITSSIPTESNGKKYSQLGYMEENQVFWALSFSFKDLKKVFL